MDDMLIVCVFSMCNTPILMNRHVNYKMNSYLVFIFFRKSLPAIVDNCCIWLEFYEKSL